MSIQLIKDVAIRAMKPRGLTRADWQAIRKKYRGKVSRTKVDFVLQAYSDGIVTRQERAGMVRLFGSSKEYRCVRRKVEGKKGRALRNIRRSLKGIAKSKNNARQKAQLALLRTLYRTLKSFKLSTSGKTASYYCGSKHNTFISRAVIGALIAMVGNAPVSRDLAKYNYDSVIGLVKTNLKTADRRSIVASLKHRSVTVRLNVLTALYGFGWRQHSSHTLKRVMYTALHDPIKKVRLGTLKILCQYHKRPAVAKVLKKFKNDKRNDRPYGCSAPPDTGETKPTDSP
jgi:hypothetical protein